MEEIVSEKNMKAPIIHSKQFKLQSTIY